MIGAQRFNRSKDDTRRSQIDGASEAMLNGFTTTGARSPRTMPRWSRTATRLTSVGLLLALAGCPTSGGPGGTTVDSAEPNESFATATPLIFGTDGIARIQGTVSQQGDIDVFLIGRLDAGTMLTADAATTGSSLDVSISFFDANEDLLFANDDRGGASRCLDSFALWTTRHDSDAYYIVVAASALAAPGTRTGSYSVDLDVARDMGVPPPVQQTLLLDFSGATLSSTVIETTQVAVFDAGAISSVYEGQTDPMKQAIVATVRENFEGLDLVVVTSDDTTPLPAESVSTVYIGGFDNMVFGLAESVDVYNFDRCDDAIIYSESFEPSAVFSFTPTVEEMGLAIGNIVSHEAGHLLGMFHVSDDTALMDDASPADAFVADQNFKRAPLAGDVVDLGSQDAPALLLEIVGPG